MLPFNKYLKNLMYNIYMQKSFSCVSLLCIQVVVRRITSRKFPDPPYELWRRQNNSFVLLEFFCSHFKIYFWREFLSTSCRLIIFSAFLVLLAALFQIQSHDWTSLIKWPERRHRLRHSYCQATSLFDYVNAKLMVFRLAMKMCFLDFIKSSMKLLWMINDSASQIDLYSGSWRNECDESGRRFPSTSNSLSEN